MYLVNVCYNLVLVVECVGEIVGYVEILRDFIFNVSVVYDENSWEVYVLVIGEMVCVCNFGFYGYERNIILLFDKMEGVVIFMDVFIQFNIIYKSVFMLFLVVLVEDYDCFYRQKGIIIVFKEVGFYIVFFLNQFFNYFFIDFLGMEVDDWKFIKKDVLKGVNILDDELLFLVEKELKVGY